MALDDLENPFLGGVWSVLGALPGHKRDERGDSGHFLYRSFGPREVIDAESGRTGSERVVGKSQIFRVGLNPKRNRIQLQLSSRDVHGHDVRQQSRESSRSGRDIKNRAVDGGQRPSEWFCKVPVDVRVGKARKEMGSIVIT